MAEVGIWDPSGKYEHPDLMSLKSGPLYHSSYYMIKCGETSSNYLYKVNCVIMGDEELADDFGYTDEQKAEYERCVKEMKNGNTNTAKKIIDKEFLKVILDNDPCVQLWGGDIELDYETNEGYSLWATFAFDKKWFREHKYHW